MALNLTVLREALADTIRNGISEDVNVYSGYRPATPQPPCILILPSDDGPYVTYEGTLNRPLATVRLSVQVLTRPGGSSTAGQRLLDEFVSSGDGATNSIYDAIRANRTLGGAVIEPVVIGDWDHRQQVAIGDTGTFAEWASLTVELRQHG